MSSPARHTTPVPAGETSIVIFELDGDRYGLDASKVERAVWAVRPTPLPGAPSVVLGVADVHGRVVPLYDVRQRFGKRQRSIAAADVLLLAKTERRPVGLLVDAVADVRPVSAAAIQVGRELLPGTELVAGAITLEDGLVLLHDLERFLSLEEREELERALEELGGTEDRKSVD